MDYHDIPDLVPTCFIPRLIWYQTDASVTIRIMLIDVDDFSLYVAPEYMEFEADVKDRKYAFVLNFFGAIKPEGCSYINNKREIRVTIPKARKWAPWLRLTYRKECYIPISVDLEKLEDDTIVVKKHIKREWDDWQEYKRKNNLFNIPPPPSDSSDSSDDEMMDALIDDLDA